MRIVFMGTPEFSVPALDALANSRHEIVAAYCQPPRPAGRGKKDKPAPVQVRAECLGISTRHPADLGSPAVQMEFASLAADVAVVAAYGLVLPKAMLDAPCHGCINIHASLLPRWRGAAPINRAIMAGDRETGISIMKMEEGLDTGPVILQSRMAIGSDETAGELHDRLAVLGARAIVDALGNPNGMSSVRQSSAGVSYAAKIDKSEAGIDWNRDADEIDRQIRGLSPYPGAWVEYKGQRIKLLKSRSVQSGGTPGMVLDDRLAVACGRGAVRILRLQRAGREAQDLDDFLRGMPLAKGEMFRNA
ncbi:MAG: methionyl-tRNA formyltransferase [Roseovarius sp.]|nr:methionyl-tRNA formyltransferase [Roseovarius sp.]